MPDNYELFIRWYLRFNGYFTIENFILHNPTQVTNNSYIGPYTESDILAVRMPHSRECVGPLRVANHEALTQGVEGLHDVVIAEVKSKKDSRPNHAWKFHEGDDPAQLLPIEYIVRFVGLQEKEEDVRTIARQLASKYIFINGFCRFRYVVFSRAPNKYYRAKGVTYITFDEVISFLAADRGCCWIKSGLGVKSVHGQWDDLIKDAFEIFNDTKIALEKKKEMVFMRLEKHDLPQGGDIAIQSVGRGGKS